MNGLKNLGLDGQVLLFFTEQEKLMTRLEQMPIGPDRVRAYTQAGVDTRKEYERLINTGRYDANELWLQFERTSNYLMQMYSGPPDDRSRLH